MTGPRNPISGVLDIPGVPESGVQSPRQDILRVLPFTYDISSGRHSGETGTIGLGAWLPDNAIVLAVVIDVITTFTDNDDDSATIAIQAEGANDLVTAVAISSGTTWDAAAGPTTVPVFVTSTTLPKTTSAKEISVVVADDEIDAGKLRGWVLYVVSE